MENKVTRFEIGGQIYAIPDAGTDQKGLISPADYQKIQGVEDGSQANVLEGVKVNNTTLAIANKIVNILIASGSTNGTISVNNANVAVKGLAALAYKANVSQSDLDSALLAVINAKAEASAVTALSNKIDTLNGSGAGSISKAINDAFNEFTTNVTNDGVVNSFKELVDWVASHGSEAAEMAAEIADLKNLLGSIGGEGEPADVEAAINAAIEKLAIGNYYTKAQADAKFLTSHQSLANYVTLDSNQTITGKKDFAETISFVNPTHTGGCARGISMYQPDKAANTRLAIGSMSNKEVFSHIYIGWGENPWLTSNCLAVSENWLKYKDHDVLHSDNYSDYSVTLDTTQTISGQKTFTKEQHFSTGTYTDPAVGVVCAIKASAPIAATRYISNVATGTAPLTVASTTAVTNLNADMVDGYHATDFANKIHVGIKYDYERIIFLLWKEDEITQHRLSGRFYTTRGGTKRFFGAEVDFWHSRWNNTTGVDSLYRMKTYGQDETRLMELVTCTYNGEKWYGLRMMNTQETSVYFIGSAGNISWGKSVVYYNSNSGTILNSEVYNSVAVVETLANQFSGSILPVSADKYTLGDSAHMYSHTYTHYIDTASGYYLRFSVAGTERMIIDTNGRVGIGTSAPTKTLDVNGAIRASSQITSTAANAFRAIYGDYGFFIRNDGGNTWFMLTNAGDTEGSYSTLRPLCINNESGFVSIGQSLYVRHGNNIDTGNVGIGIGAPAHKLDVKGDINAERLYIYGSASSNAYIFADGVSNLGVNVGGKSLMVWSATSTAQAVRCATSLPGEVDLGTADYPWKGIYGKTGNFAEGLITPALRPSRGFNIRVGAPGWYRVYTSAIGDAGGDNVLLDLARTWNNTNNEAYRFSISLACMGNTQDIRVPQITQISGTCLTNANQHLITKIRVLEKFNSIFYIDFYYAGSVENAVTVSGIGVGTFCTPVAAEIPDGYNSYEFETTNGLVVNNAIKAFKTILSTPTRSAWAHAFRGMTSDMVEGDTIGIRLGKAESAYNEGYIAYKYVSAADNTQNFLSLGLHSQDHRVVVHGSGYVGVNTPTPTAQLDVNGNARVVGALTIQSGSDNKIILDSTDGEYFNAISFREAGTQYAAIYVDGRNGGTNFRFDGMPVRANRFISDVATGTAPITAVSTTVCTNLNADMLDGLHASNFPQFTSITSRENWTDCVILLWRIDTAGYCRLLGNLFCSADGAQRYHMAELGLWFARWSNGTDHCYKFAESSINNSNTRLRLVTCTYEGAQYLAIRCTNVLSTQFYFQGTSRNVLWKRVDYRKQAYTYNGVSHTAEVLNEEVMNSIAFETLNHTYQGSLVPDSDNQYTLGVSELKYSTAYLKSCHIGDAEVTYADNLLKVNGVRINQKSYTPTLAAKPTSSTTIYNDPDTGKGVAFQEGQCALYPSDETSDGYGLSIVKKVLKSGDSVVRVYWFHATEVEKRLTDLETTVNTIKDNVGVWVNEKLT